MYAPVRKPEISQGGRRHVITSLVLLLTVVLGGVVGYILIENMDFTNALYMTVIIISTVGLREVQPLGTGGVYFTIALIVTGVSAMLFFLASVFELVLNEYLGDIWGRRRMKSNIAKHVDHYIVCGYGRVGRSVAEELSAQGKPLVVIEMDGEHVRHCADDGFAVIHGDATDSEVLEEAGIEKATGLVSALRSDADNLYVVLSARVIRPDILLVARADQPEAEKKLVLVGADRVILTHHIAGKRMANLMIRPGACEFLDMVVGGNLPEYQLIELGVTRNTPLHEKTIRGTRLRENTGVTILSIKKMGQEAFNPNPSPDTLIEEGDILILIGTPEQMESVETGA
ncbi:MAG: potassium channel protein [Actinobacteria bacterium]|nr:potassium channel protein [Actinomycetota bacterium]MBU4240787.1 potassium channel protein [Actinomycetota bacterium]MBU4489915.1 potassium channel protein [Actinomycetota bacterium]MCG2795811.1 potassium channel protein [Actinomycetes bacterium]